MKNNYKIFNHFQSFNWGFKARYENVNIVTSIEKNKAELNQNILSQNVPNPFSQNTEIFYDIHDFEKESKLHIYNIQGIEFKYVPMVKRGKGSLQIDSAGLQSGIYIYSLDVDNKFLATKQMV